MTTHTELEALTAINESFDLVRKTFRDNRSLILERAGNVAFDSKHDGSPVTDTDIEIEKALQAVMARQYPTIPVYGEETGYDTTLPEICWLVDPIDGTQSFINNVPTFTSMAVLIQHGISIAAIIYNPSTDEMYTAKRGEGAYKNTARLDLAAQSLPLIALCKVELVDPLNKVVAAHAIRCEPAPTGGGYGFTMILDNVAAARFQIRGKGWIHDYAPGALLVQEAGGVIIPVRDETYTYTSRSFVAAHPSLKETLEAQVPTLRSLEEEA
ncbi:inositol monophosphatase family protein [bacterium]|nr:MAG: inositol monophosphatase family protein [bacterium]